jgi:fumarate reductase subunit D
MSEEKERFIRWHAITLEARGKIIALVLSLSLATIAYAFNLIKDTNFVHCYSKCFCFLGIITLLVTIVFALFVMMNRLKGFRETTQKIKAEIDGEEKDAIASLKKKYEETDKITLHYFQVMIWFFGFGETFVILGLIIEFWSKLI